MINACEFGADSSRSHHDQGLRHFGEFENVVRIYDLLAIRLKTRDRPHDGAGRDDDVLRLDRLFLAVRKRDLDLSFAQDLAETVKDRNLILLHQIGHAGRVFRNNVGFVLLDARPVVLEAFYLQAEILKMRSLVIEMGRVQQRLCRDTSAQAARSAKPRVLFLFDDRDLQTQLPRSNRRYIAAGPRTDDSYVKLFRHRVFPLDYLVTN